MTNPIIGSSVLDLIGRTPLVRLQRLPDANGASVYAKLENLNPAGSVKDRIALAMIEEAERQGILHGGDTIVEPTSGNTGVGLAMVCAVKGYRLVLTMPDDMSAERRRLLARFGVEILLTPAIEGMTGAVFAAEEYVRQNPRAYMPQQFVNPANPDVHYRCTGPEIANALERIDALVVGVGTGGTFTGIGRYLRERGYKAKLIAVEPARSPVLAGGRFRPHSIQGIGASFVPGVLDKSLIDEVIGVRDDDALATASRLTRQEGLLVGISAGANVWASCRVASRYGTDAVVVTLLPDTGERYLSMNFTDDERTRNETSSERAGT